jgi:glycine betaine/proline transport system ATP-binding protein
MIEFENVNVVFGKQPQRALPMIEQGLSRDVIREKTDLVVGVNQANLKVEQGEIFVLMGLSGSGKSSLLRCVNGLNEVTSGSIRIQDGDQQIDFTKASESVQRELRTRKISMVFQNFALFPWMTVEENVAFGLEMQGLPKPERREKTQRQLELVGLSEWANHRPDELSGGMRQRVGLARALATESDILLMDEPFSALDPLIREQLQDELLEMQRLLNKTILFVSHDLDEALKIGNRIAIMKDGEIVQQGRPEQIVLDPATDYVRNFVASTNPLNVLHARSVLQSLDTVETDERGRKLVSKAYDIWLESPGDAAAAVIFQHEDSFDTQAWQPGEAISSLSKRPTRVPPKTSLREAVEIRYVTGHCVLVEENNQMIGFVADKQIYHSLLGKHLD